MEWLKHIKGIIFDLDGTLLDSMHIWADIDQCFLEKQGIEVPKDYMGVISSLSFYETALYTINRFHLSLTPNQLIEEWLEMASIRYRNEVKLKEGVYEYLKDLQRQSIPMTIATACDEKLFLTCLKNNKINTFFQHITTVKEVKKSKEFPDIYLACAKKMNLCPSECVVFEDISKGLKSAKEAGFYTIGVQDKSASYEEEEVKKYADIYITSFLDIQKEVEK